MDAYHRLGQQTQWWAALYPTSTVQSHCRRNPVSTGRPWAADKGLYVRVAYEVLVKERRLSAIAEEFGVTQERVRQLFRLGLRVALQAEADPAAAALCELPLPTLRQQTAQLAPKLQAAYEMLSARHGRRSTAS